MQGFNTASGNCQLQLEYGDYIGKTVSFNTASGNCQLQLSLKARA